MSFSLHPPFLFLVFLGPHNFIMNMIKGVYFDQNQRLRLRICYIRDLQFKFHEILLVKRLIAFMIGGLTYIMSLTNVYLYMSTCVIFFILGIFFILFISLSRVVIIIVSFLHLQVLVIFYGILLLVFLRVVNRCLSYVSTQFFSQTYVLLKVCPW